MIELLIATTNKNKVREIEKIFENDLIEFRLYTLDQKRLKFPAPENGKTFLENAASKSVFYSKFEPELLVVAEDSGLEVESLNNEPGVYSARYAGDNANDEENISKLLKNLNGIENRKARFVSVVSLSKDSRLIKSFIGEVEGIITHEKIGENGFGYDPVFYYPQYNMTFAQISLEQKNKISHRRKVFEKLKNYLMENIDKFKKS